MPLPPPETMEFNDRRTGAGYGRHDTHRLNPGRLTHPLPETVELLVDERSEHVAPLFADVANLEVTRTRLPVGDLCAVHGDAALLFSLTTAHEIGLAMDDGRLARLVRDLCRVSHPACVIVEGGLYQEKAKPLARLSALHARLTFGVSIPVMETIDRRHTAYMVVCSARDRFFPDLVRGRFDPVPTPLPHFGVHDVARHMLEMIQGVSHGRAGALLDRFGSLAGIAKADRKALAETDGIGTVTAARIVATLAGAEAVACDAGASPMRQPKWTALSRF